MKKTVLALLACVLCFGVNAQNIYLTADTSIMRIGEQVSISLSAKIDLNTSDKKLVWPVFTDSLANGKMLVVERLPVDSFPIDKDKPSVYLLKQKIILTSFEPGTYKLEPFYAIKGEDSLASNTLSFEVKSITVDTTKAFKEIKDIIEVRYTWIDWLVEHKYPIAAGAVLLAVLVYFIRRYLKSRKNRPVVEKAPAPVIPAHILALEALQVIQQKKSWQYLEPKDFYTELTAVLRNYIEKRFGIAAHEQTSVEILLALRRTNCPDGAKIRLRDLLTMSDLAKFAKQKTSDEESAYSLEDAIQFVELSKEVLEKSIDEREEK